MENNLDKLFKSKLGGMEPEFHPAAWERMEGLLEESDMTPIQEVKAKKSRKRFLLFLLTGLGLLFSGIGYYSIESIDTNDTGSAWVQSENMESLNSLESKESKYKTTGSTKTRSTEKLNENTTTKSEENSLNSNYNQASIVSIIGEAKADAISNSSEVLRKSKTEILSKKKAPSLRSELDAEEVKEERARTGKKDQIIADGRSEVMKEETVSVSNNNMDSKIEGGSKSSEHVPSVSSPQVIAGLEVLETRGSDLFKLHKLVSPQIQIIKPSFFVVGIHASIRPAGGLSYSIGPYVNLSMGNGFGLNTGVQFDMQNFGGGPELNVYDKVYSFGSKLKERTFTLSNQKSIRVPLTLRKSFSFFGVSAGLIYNRVLTSGGDVGDTGETGSKAFIQVENDLLRASTISMQVGASFSLSRYLELELGLEYRPKVFYEDVSVSNNANKYYPSLGVRYKLFKF